MKKVKIEIKSCKSKLFWYYDKIGQTYDAKISFFGNGMVEVGKDILIVQKEDFEIIKDERNDS